MSCVAVRLLFFIQEIPLCFEHNLLWSYFRVFFRIARKMAEQFVETNQIPHLLYLTWNQPSFSHPIGAGINSSFDIRKQLKITFRRNLNVSLWLEYMKVEQICSFKNVWSNNVDLLRSDKWILSDLVCLEGLVALVNIVLLLTSSHKLRNINRPLAN